MTAPAARGGEACARTRMHVRESGRGEPGVRDRGAANAERAAGRARRSAIERSVARGRNDHAANGGERGSDERGRRPRARSRRGERASERAGDDTAVALLPPRIGAPLQTHLVVGVLLQLAVVHALEVLVGRLADRDEEEVVAEEPEDEEHKDRAQEREKYDVRLVLLVCRRHARRPRGAARVVTLRERWLSGADGRRSLLLMCRAFISRSQVSRATDLQRVAELVEQQTRPPAEPRAPTPLSGEAGRGAPPPPHAPRRSSLDRRTGKGGHSSSSFTRRAVIFRSDGHKTTDIRAVVTRDPADKGS